MHNDLWRNRVARLALRAMVSGLTLAALALASLLLFGPAGEVGAQNLPQAYAAQAVPTPTAVPTRAPVVRRTAANSSTPARAPVATVAPLDFSFHVDAYCITRKTQELWLVITAHGGQPPYTYYNDATQLDKTTSGSVWYKHTAPAGNPVPFKLIVVDSAGRKYMQEFFYKTYLHCGF